jgi:hypothetical protein
VKKPTKYDEKRAYLLSVGYHERVWTPVKSLMQMPGGAYCVVEKSGKVRYPKPGEVEQMTGGAA